MASDFFLAFRYCRHVHNIKIGSTKQTLLIQCEKKNGLVHQPALKLIVIIHKKPLFTKEPSDQLQNYPFFRSWRNIVRI